MKFDYTKKILIISILVFVTIVIEDIVFTNTLVSKIISINSKTVEMNVIAEEKIRETNLGESIAETEVERKLLDQYFVGSGNADTVEFTKNLEILAKDFNLTQNKTLNYEPAVGLESSESVSVIRYRFDVSGKWSDVYNFIQAVENLPKVAYVNSVNLNLNSGLSSAKRAGWANKIWTANLDFSVLKFKDQTNLQKQ
jgi:hypothetical protein